MRSLELVSCLILGHFRSFYGGVHQFLASVAKGVGRREVVTACQKLSREAPQ